MAALAAVAVPESEGRAQERSCARIAFGPWTPALEWNRAGHRDSVNRVGRDLRAVRDSVFAGATTTQGRDGMDWFESEGFRKLFLSPVWWPAGVLITFDAPSRGDTLVGHAVALVADASRPTPRASARVMNSCGDR